MPRGDRSLLLGLAVVGVLFAATQPLTGVDPDVLLAAPLLLLLLPLLAGRYVGEASIARLAGRLMPRRRRPDRAPAAPARRTARVLPRGGRLIAAALADRGPPAPATA